MNVFCLILLSAFLYLANARGPQYDLKDAPNLFLKFMKDYNREYKNSEEVIKRYAVFLSHLKEINAKNKQMGETATFGINQFADVTDEEFQKTLNHFSRSKRKYLSWQFKKYPSV